MVRCEIQADKGVPEENPSKQTQTDSRRGSHLTGWWVRRENTDLEREDIKFNGMLQWYIRVGSEKRPYTNVKMKMSQLLFIITWLVTIYKPFIKAACFKGSEWNVLNRKLSWFLVMSQYSVPNSSRISLAVGLLVAVGSLPVIPYILM